MKSIFTGVCLILGCLVNAQTIDIHNSLIRSFKPNFSKEVKHVDLDNDGNPDLILTTIMDSIPVIWIDDDSDMTWDDLEGDMDNDCLIIDRNRDGIFAGPGDLSIDWVDTNNDGIADKMLVVENSNPDITNKWDWASNYMWIIDLDKDETFHYINWKELVLRCWSHYGASDFYEDYHGQTLFLKTHAPSYRFSNLSYGWENPFLFYDPDNDGLTEMSIRLGDSGRFDKEKSDDKTKIDSYPTGNIDNAFLSFDLDNDNGPSNEFDLDMSLSFRGEGFSYHDQVHHFENKRLNLADSLFFDKRWRHVDSLVYTNHDSAWTKIFNEGKWDQCWFVFDEDDDCERWERVEFYQPLNPFKIGRRSGGLDNHAQSDASGDRGEWDMDNSGNGNLYIGFDGRIHLLGAEIGYWRVDQDATSYQGWGGLYEGGFHRLQAEPEKFATVFYEDTNDDGFFDRISYDLDGDTIYEQVFNLTELGIKPEYQVLDMSSAGYEEVCALHEQSSLGIWSQAEKAIEAAKKFNINYKWYAQLLHPKSLEQKYRQGYWLQFYLFSDLLELANSTNNEKLKTEIIKAYFQQKWENLL